MSMQNKDGGYCPHCDTVWASPGKCRCEEVVEPMIYKSFEIEIWNAAIEAAAKKADNLIDHIGYGLAEDIRKLKK